MTAQQIRWLFDEIWPVMLHAAGHRDSCIRRLSEINAAFSNHPNDPDAIFGALDAIDGIGVVIASGLMFASDPSSYVPFDKWTTGLALQQRFIRTNVISPSYSKFSNAVLSKLPPGVTVLDFVRSANASTVISAINPE